MSSRITIRNGLLGLGLGAALSLGSARAVEPLPDPTRPPEAVRVNVVPVGPAEDGVLDLRAIFHAGDRRVAVINGRRVHESDSIGDARVVAIGADRVRLRRGTETIELELVSPAFKNARRAGPRREKHPARAAAAQISGPQGGSQ